MERAEESLLRDTVHVWHSLGRCRKIISELHDGGSAEAAGDEATTQASEARGLAGSPDGRRSPKEPSAGAEDMLDMAY